MTYKTYSEAEIREIRIVELEDKLKPLDKERERILRELYLLRRPHVSEDYEDSV